jgi:hypothetical protein
MEFIIGGSVKNNNNILYAQGEGMFATGAEVNLEILLAESLEKEENSIVRYMCSRKRRLYSKMTY